MPPLARPLAKRNARSCAVAFIGALLSFPSMAAQWELLGDLPGGNYYSRGLGISADGRTVAGVSDSTLAAADDPDYTEAMRWSRASGMTALGDLPGGQFDSWAYDISADGEVVIGYGRIGDTANDIQAMQWTSAGGMVSLGGLGASGISLATAIASNGQTIVGGAISDAGTEAFRWTAADGMIGLGDFPSGYFHSYARGTNFNGEVVVGNSLKSAGTEAFRWTAADGLVGLGELPGGSYFSAAYGVSDDGNVIVGGSTSAASYPNREAFRWTPETGMVGLGDLPGDTAFSSYALAVSADGSTIVGFSLSPRGKEGTLWTEATGLLSLTDHILDLGVDLQGLFLGPAFDISPNGRFISGSMTNHNGNIEAYVVDLQLLQVEIDFDTYSNANNLRPDDAYFSTIGIKTMNRADGDALDFDATQINADSVQIGPGLAPNIALPLSSDFDNDGDADLSVGFRVEDSGIACGDTEISISGETYSGELFTGSDSINTTDCTTGNCHP
jgi:probable HAF family extracellular repeat protein